MIGRYFESNIQEIERAVAEANRIILTEGDLSLNDFYACLDLEAIELGEELGWSDGGPIILLYGAEVAGEAAPKDCQGGAIITMSFKTKPKSATAKYV